MGSAVANLRNAVVASNQSLTQRLRQAKVIATSLGLEDVERWVDLELNGYPQATEPPDYRTVFACNVDSRGEDLRFKLRAPIHELEASAQRRHVEFALDWDTQYASPFAERLRVPGAQYKDILQTVTNRLLEWTIELQKRGIKGEDIDFNEKEKEAAVNQTFNIGHMVGVAGNVHGSQVTVYDYSSINQLLVDHGIPKLDRRELEDIMEEMRDAPPEKKKPLLQRAEAWVVKHKELLGAGAEAVGKAIGSAMNKG
jgi:hypothetical protein